MTAVLQVFRGSHVRLWLAGVLAIAVDIAPVMLASLAALQQR